MGEVGRPTKYKEEYNIQAKKLCRLGAIDKEIADFFGVAESTISLWKEEYPEFSVSINAGKILADANVAQALYHRAIGYEHEDVDIRVVDKEIVQTTLTKYYPPDPTAIIFWLKNRQSARWRDKQEVDQKTEHSGSIDITWQEPDLRPRQDQGSASDI